MQALARAIERGSLLGWTLPEEPDGGVPTHSALLEAAASTPLRLEDGEFVFDRDELLRAAFQARKGDAEP